MAAMDSRLAAGPYRDVAMVKSVLAASCGYVGRPVVMDQQGAMS